MQYNDNSQTAEVKMMNSIAKVRRRITEDRELTWVEKCVKMLVGLIEPKLVSSEHFKHKKIVVRYGIIDFNICEVYQSWVLNYMLWFWNRCQEQKFGKRYGTLVCQGCHNNVPQIGWFKQQFIVPQFWRLEIWNQGVNVFWFFVSPLRAVRGRSI